MKTTEIHCPKCNEALEIPIGLETMGEELKCDSCKCIFVLPTLENKYNEYGEITSLRSTRQNHKPTTQDVVVTDIKMKFTSMIWFMVKWTIASIPAAIILFVASIFLISFFGAMFSSYIGSR